MVQMVLEDTHKADIIKLPVEYQEEVAQMAPETHKTKRRTTMECLYNEDEIRALYKVFKRHIEEADTFAKEKVATVSYTHLTLPTILRV